MLVQAAEEERLNAADEAEREAEAKIRGTFAQVDAWNTATRFTPVPGSQLDADDVDWLPMPMTESVRLELELAAEQLHQVKVMLEAGELSLSAQRVVVRTALISASIATWILSPDDAVERCARHRLLVEETTFRHHQALAEQANLEKEAGHPVQQNLRIMVDHTAQRLSQIKALRMTDQRMERWNDTEIIRKAALFAFRRQAEPAALAKEAVLEFRITSGASHGLAWGLFNATGIRATTAADAHDRAMMIVAPTYSALANGYMAAYWISTSAWKLLQRRGRGTTGTMSASLRLTWTASSVVSSAVTE
jgi:hypothetical protein